MTTSQAILTTTTSPIVLGAMFFGTTIDERTSFALLDRFVERGGTWIDTADCYSFWTSDTGHGGDSERVLGRWLGQRPDVRDRVRIATKVGAEPLWPGSWPDQRSGLSRRSIRDAFEGSLRRLDLDAVDLLWLHAEDRRVRIEETVDALGELVEEGRVRRTGASNHPAWRVERARRHATEHGLLPIDALQLCASYVSPRPGTRPRGHAFGVLNDEQRDYARTHGLEVWSYSPLLRGSYDRPDRHLPEEYDHPATTRRLAVLDGVARELGARPGQVVFAWLLRHGIRPMLGCSTLEQLDLSLDAAALELPDDLLRRLDEPV
jgi:aryl-alcohol dehydrogenase-like predicted oxidoreductase